MPLMDRA